MRVLVCGGRNYHNKTFIFKILDDLKQNNVVDCIIEGNASGADRIAGYWARSNKITNIKFMADWENLGVAAGPVRNRQMLIEGKPDLVIAFPGGRGTANMISQAKKFNVEVIIFDE